MLRSSGASGPCDVLAAGSKVPTLCYGQTEEICIAAVCSAEVQLAVAPSLSVSVVIPLLDASHVSPRIFRILLHDDRLLDLDAPDGVAG